MRRFVFTLLLLAMTLALGAQEREWVWHNPMNQEFHTIQNRGWNDEMGDSYDRLPARAEKLVTVPQWDLQHNTAGMAIHFITNATEIRVRYQTTSKNYSMNHMQSTGKSGVDLFRINGQGEQHRSTLLYQFKDTVLFTFPNLSEKDRYHKKGFEYRLYLPLYNGVKWMEIGVQDGFEFEFIEESNEKPIVIHGTSILQGACASRPGMAWSNILQRRIDYPIINLGFSGNGRMDEGIMSMINEIDARLYILDCIPNLTGEDQRCLIVERVLNAVRKIRKSHSAPILLVGMPAYGAAHTDTVKARQLLESNIRADEAYERVLSEGFKDVYYLPVDELKFNEDMFVDYVHPNDYGMVQYANVIEKKVREILHVEEGDYITQKPVTQRREPGNYDWLKRHRTQIEKVKEAKPKALIIGNSITHFWGDTTVSWTRGKDIGQESWAKMKKAGFYELGCGWDYIENVLWRVYHGELDGYKVNKVLLAIGTNNIGKDSDEAIVEGLRKVLREIRYRQPQASITMMGIYPRKNLEKRVEKLNTKIRQMAEVEGFGFADPGRVFLKEDGTIEPKWFSDGLHPNKAGYNLIVDEILKIK